MNVLPWIFTALAAYFLGNANGAILTSHLLFHEDVRKSGSGNAGLTNFYRVYGGWAAFCVIFIDAGKALLSVLLGGLLFSAYGLPLMTGRYFAALCVVIGHIFPVFFGFKGGKGILSAGAAMWLLDWRVASIAFLLFIAAFLLTRYVSLGSIIGAASFPISTWFFFAFSPELPCLLTFSVLTAALALWSHRGNMDRLMFGRERKFHFHRWKNTE